MVDVFTRREFLAQALRRHFETEAQGSAQDLGFFVDPSLRTLADETVRPEALAFLSNWLTGGIPADSSVGVLIADGGIGKTTLSRQLRNHIIRTRSGGELPLLIESDHWKKLADTPDLDLWDVWRQSLASQAPAITSEQTFNVHVAEGLLVLIFDGFDELCSLRRRQFRVDDTLKQLRDLLDGADGRLLMTTRKGYWEEHVSPESRAACTVFELLPFDQHKRDKFFETRFASDFPARDRAKKVSQRLEQHLYADQVEKYPPPPERPTAIPAILELICASVEDDVSADSIATYGPLMENNPLQMVLMLLCERERRRQGLIASADEQIRLFAELAIDMDERFSTDDISFYSQAMCQHFESEEQRRPLFAPHPMLRREGDFYSFRFSFLRAFLQSYWLESHWADAESAEKLAKILVLFAAGDSPAIEYLAQRLLRLHGPDKWRKSLPAYAAAALESEKNTVSAPGSMNTTNNWVALRQPSNNKVKN